MFNRNTALHLAELFINSAVEIDEFLIGRNDNFSHTKDLHKALEKYQPKESDDFISAPNFPYFALHRAAEKHSGRKLAHFSEIVGEFSRVKRELQGVPYADAAKMGELRDYMCSLSREMFAESVRNYSKPAA